MLDIAEIHQDSLEQPPNGSMMTTKGNSLSDWGVELVDSYKRYGIVSCGQCREKMRTGEDEEEEAGGMGGGEL